jgi:hypothetical protein
MTGLGSASSSLDDRGDTHRRLVRVRAALVSSSAQRLAGIEQVKGTCSGQYCAGTLDLAGISRSLGVEPTAASYCQWSCITGRVSVGAPM